jgi:hypothetical protein
MTEEQWQASDEPHPLLNWVGPSLSMRKARLYAVAACRRVWELLQDPRSREVVEAAEAWADREMSWQEVGVKRKRADAYFNEVYLRQGDEWRQQAGLAWAARLAAARTRAEVDRAAWQVLNVLAPDGRRPVRDRPLADLLRDIVGNPFRPVRLSMSWLAWTTDAVVRLARAIYEERRWGDLPILADALEEAGCTDKAALKHCRGPGPHSRGCWVCDLLLAKE